MLAGHCEAQERRGPSPSMECRATGRLGSCCRDNTTGAVRGTWGHWEAKSALTTGMALLELQEGCWGRSGLAPQVPGPRLQETARPIYTQEPGAGEVTRVLGVSRLMGYVQVKNVETNFRI